MKNGCRCKREDRQVMGEVRDRFRSWRRTMGPYQMLLHPGEYGNMGAEAQPYVGLYDRPLPCCGCGVGWCCFLMGFILPLFWYYGTFLFLGQCQNDPRERPGLAASAIAALVNTVALILALIALFVQHQGFFQSSSTPQAADY
ncbi:hypothetical protein M758_3G082100 [Ceratodon purpureus]|uniref:60S ribosomal protein L18a-like protein n=1 Tax=Ceratodon purpureus TaxID=3225 RepID=A0A8T0II89_CERPU|nr:hypothetical protein KC19_3G080700 [Ceratodon purpureus]KAG0622229.1 hypothetical protein M758_3G082100 [Ceratodon purpureus]